MTETAIPFETFAQWNRIEQAGPLFASEPGEWAAAAHAIVVGDTVEYLWAHRSPENAWLIMHSSAPVHAPWEIEHDPRNPVVTPASEGHFDDYAVEYPFPFVSPLDGRTYCYYLGRRRRVPKQTGLLVSDGDFGAWTRMTTTPVIPVETDFEVQGSSHPSVAIDGDTIHILYTGEFMETDQDGTIPVLCHATAPLSDPTHVTKDEANPVFVGTDQPWDSFGVREAEILKGPEYFHIFYGQGDIEGRSIGHVRTRDFRTFEPNPYNPIFTPSDDPDAWDSDGILTPQVFAANGTYYMLYAGRGHGRWQSGLAVIGVQE